MNELHSLAYTSSLYHYGSSLGLDYDHNIGVLNADKMSLTMDGSATSFSPQEYSDFSTGYLEDALIEFGERSKRRRLLPYSTDDEQSKSFIVDLEKSFLDFNPIWHQPVDDFYCMNQIERFCGFSDEHMSTFRSRISEEPSILVGDTKTPEEETISASESPNSSSSSYKEQVTSKTSGGDDEDYEMMLRRSKKKKKEEEEVITTTTTTRVVYPFAMVKPGGIREGEVTLSDINERILMAPTRPVRHPVGDFACRPACVSPDGPGLSGKAVVALTTIHTLGRRGTITIIRTKG